MDLFFREERQGDRVKIVMDVKEGMEPDAFALNMFRYNTIRYLVPVQQMRFNDRVCFQYDVTAMKPLSERLQQMMRKEEAVRMFDGILTAFEETDAYMLTETNLVLDREHVYVDDSGQCHFIYLPLEQDMGAEQLGFLRDLAGWIIPAQGDKDTYLFDIQNAFSRGAVNRLSDFKDMIHKAAAERGFGAADEAGTAAAPAAAESAPDGEKTGVSFNVPEKKGAGISFSVPDKKKSGISFSVPEKKKGTEASPGAPEKKKSGISFNVPDKKGTEASPSAPEKKRSGLSFNVPDKKGAGISFNVPDKKAAPDSAVMPEKNAERAPFAIPEGNSGGSGANGEKKGIGRMFAGKKSTGGHGREKTAKNAVSDIPAAPAAPVQQKSAIYADYEKTVFMEQTPSEKDDPGETICLQESGLGPIGELIRQKTGEHITIMQSGAVIGSGASADCVIRDNRAVSRNHAMIVLQNGTFYLTDKHSSNGTSVNGRKLEPEQETEIADGALIRLADEEFEFRAL